MSPSVPVLVVTDEIGASSYVPTLSTNYCDQSLDHSCLFLIKELHVHCTCSYIYKHVCILFRWCSLFKNFICSVNTILLCGVGLFFQLNSIADRTITEADTDGDFMISFGEFLKVGYKWIFSRWKSSRFLVCQLFA